MQTDELKTDELKTDELKTDELKTDELETRKRHNQTVVTSYPIQVSALCEEEGGGFQALFPPLARSIVGYGATSQEAISDLYIVLPTFLKLMDKTEQTLPEAPAEKEWDEFSGKFNVRVAKMLHAQLSKLAEEQNVSLNSLVQTILASGATALTAGKQFGALEPNTEKNRLGTSTRGTEATTNGSHRAAS